MHERTKNLLSFAAGVATGATLPVVLPAVAEAGRPMAKALIKHGLLGFERLRTSIARASESVEDLVAEARAEAAQASTQASTQARVHENESPAEPARTDSPSDGTPTRPSLVVMS